MDPDIMLQPATGREYAQADVDALWWVDSSSYHCLFDRKNAVLASGAISFIVS